MQLELRRESFVPSSPPPPPPTVTHRWGHPVPKIRVTTKLLAVEGREGTLNYLLCCVAPMPLLSDVDVGLAMEPPFMRLLLPPLLPLMPLTVVPALEEVVFSTVYLDFRLSNSCPNPGTSSYRIGRNWFRLMATASVLSIRSMSSSGSRKPEVVTELLPPPLLLLGPPPVGSESRKAALTRDVESHTIWTGICSYVRNRPPVPTSIPSLSARIEEGHGTFSIFFLPHFFFPSR